MWIGSAPFPVDKGNCDTICIDGSYIDRMNSYSYLGVKLDCLLTYDKPKVHLRPPLLN